MILDINDKINSKKIDELKEKMKEELNDFSKIIFEERYLNLIKENIDFKVKIED